MAIAESPPSAAPLRNQGEGERVLALIEEHATWALAALLLAAGALLMYMGRGLTFYYDEWDFVQKDYGGGWHILVTPHVGNLVFFPAIVYKVLFHVAGLDHYWVFRLVLVLLHLVAGSLVYMLAARRTTRVNSLLAAALVLFLSMAWEDLLWAFQISYVLSTAFGLGAWVLIEREDRWGDVGAMLCVLVSIGSVSLGLAVAVALFVELAWRREARRMWIVLVPVALYAAWYLGYGESQVTAESLIHAPGFVADLAAAAIGALAGRGLEWGRPLAVLSTLVLLVRLARPGPIRPRLAGLIAAAVGLWVITAAARSTISPPETSRYLYLGAIAIVLIGVELLRGTTIGPRAVAIATVLVVFSALSGLTTLHAGAQGLRSTSETLKAELGALELAASHAPPEYRPDPVRAPTLEAGPYLHTVRSIGSSPADTPTEIEAAANQTREAADTVLLALYKPVPEAVKRTPSALAPSPALVTVSGGVADQRGACVRIHALGAAPATAVFTLPAGGVVIHDEGGHLAALAMRRYGEGFDTLSSAARPDSVSQLSVPSDRGGVSWQMEESSTAPVSVCGFAA